MTTEDHRDPRRRLVPAIAAVVALLAIAGCGSDDSSTKASSGTSSSASEPAFVKDAKASVSSLTGEAALSEGKAEPFTPPPGKTVGLLNCGNEAVDCVDTVKGMEKAAALMGWKSVVKQNGLSPTGWATSMQQLVQEKPDGIISLVAADSTIPNAMKDAAKAKIPVIGLITANKFVKPIATPSTANVDVDYAKQGKISADYIIANSGGKAKVLEITDPTAVANVARSKAFHEELAKCTSCKLVQTINIDNSLDQIQAGLKAAQAGLAANPAGKVDWIQSMGSVRDPGILQAVKQAGRDKDVSVVSVDCKEASLASIQEGGALKACLTTPLVRSGWAAVDAMARLLGGKNPGQVFVPFSIVTKDNAPSAEEIKQRGKDTPLEVFTEPDYESYYKSQWGK